VKYLNNISAEDKFQKWILLELYKRTLAETFREIFHVRGVMHEYKEEDTLRKLRKEIKERLDRIEQLDYVINSKFLEQYEEDQKQKLIEMEKQKEEEVAPKEEEHKEEKIVSIGEIRDNLDRFKKLLDQTEGEKKLEQRQSFIRDDYKILLEKERQEAKPFDVIRHILGPSKPRKTIRRLPSQPKLLRRASSFDDLDAKKVSLGHRQHEDESNLTTKLLNLFTFDRENKKMSASTTRRSEHDKTISSIPEQFDHSFRSGGHHGLDQSYDSHSAGLSTEEFLQFKRSERLLLQKYRIIQQEYEYRDPPIRVIKAEDQGYKCFSCSTQLNKILVTVWSSKFFCHYTGYWYCSECMSDDKCMIPWYVQDNFDFKKYHICKTAREELIKYYDKPNMLIDSKSETVQKNKTFYETLVRKRELHLMYDMICEGLYVLDLVGQEANLLLKINLLSLKQIVEIKEGALVKFIERIYGLLNKHIQSCNICQSKGKICPHCHDKKRIFPYDIRNTSICRNCKTLFHTHCLKRRSCVVCNHNY